VKISSYIRFDVACHQTAEAEVETVLCVFAKLFS
jgi:hypothetical protein